MLKEDFGQNVRYYRKEKKSTLEAAAELCDITSDKITRFSFERNLRVFLLNAVLRLGCTTFSELQRGYSI